MEQLISALTFLVQIIAGWYVFFFGLVIFLIIVPLVLTGAINVYDFFRDRKRKKSFKKLRNR